MASLVGYKNNFLEVISFSHKKTGTFWHCKCLSCGRIFLESQTRIVEKRSKGCGCIKEVETSKAVPGKQALNQILNQYVQNSRKTKRSFELNRDDFLKLVSGDCFYCGRPPMSLKKSKRSRFMYNGIDRKENDLGYTVKNCVTCCKTCNYAKRGLSHEEFLKHIKECYVHLFVNQLSVNANAYANDVMHQHWETEKRIFEPFTFIA